MSSNKDKFNEEDFKKLLDALSEDLLNAGHHFRIYRNLEESMEKYETERQQCPAFWELTINAHLEVSLLYLCRAYDNYNTKALSLKELINLIRKNIDLFQISDLEERFKSHDFPDIFVSDLNEQLKQDLQNQTLTDQLDEDLKFVSNNNSLVNKLTILRGHFIAHKNIKQTLNDSLPPLTTKEVETLIEKGLKICNRYRALFDGSIQWPQLINGEDDYKMILKYIRIGLKAIDFKNGIEPDPYITGIKAIEFSQQIDHDLYN
jgi:hypothetical protein